MRPEKYQVIIDTFTNYGYIDLYTIEEDEILRRFMKDHLIKRERITSPGKWPKFHFFGPKVWLMKMTDEIWHDYGSKHFIVISS